MSTAAPKSSTVKVGILTIVSIALLVFVLVWLRGRGLGGDAYTVLFHDVDGMREGAPVQMMGIRVGFVDAITPTISKDGKYYVEVKFNLNPLNDVEVVKGSKLAIEQSGIIGEKFLEITPPQLKEVTLTTFKAPAKKIQAGIPVKFLYEEGYMQVGVVEAVNQTEDENMMRHKLFYRITTPGAMMPEDPMFELTMDANQNYYLLIVPREPILVHKPDPNLRFTIENPLRIKRFLEIQMESAEALKTTNDKINQLLSDDTIDTLNSTLKNTEVMTARATEVLDSANKLFQTTGKDLEGLVSSSKKLAENVSVVSENLNDILGDPELKQDIVSTVDAIEKSSVALSELMEDANIQETLMLMKDTSQNASELVAYLKETAQDEDLQNRLDTSLTLLNTSLSKLTVVLDNIDEVTNDEEPSIKGIIEDTQETAKNMRKLSDKFGKRFTLFRLLF